jgi:lysophospholipase
MMQVLIQLNLVDNLLNSLIIAGHFVIPEVGLCFDNKLFRGNRCSKVNALDFSAFDSPNLRALVNIGINIDVSWQDVWKPSAIDRFVAHKVRNLTLTQGDAT